MKYGLLNRIGQVIKGINIDESAKKDFMKMMEWDAGEWQRRTYKINSETSHNSRKIQSALRCFYMNCDTPRFKDKIFCKKHDKDIIRY